MRFVVTTNTEIRLELLNQCHGSIEEAQRLLVELRRKSQSKGATDFDERRFSVITRIYKKMQNAAEKEGNAYTLLFGSEKDPLHIISLTYIVQC